MIRIWLFLLIEKHLVCYKLLFIGQSGNGHFSPIAAYHKKTQKVLILDTARFKYPSYFVSIDQLYSALNPLDTETGLSRGYFLLSKGKLYSSQSLLRLNFKLNSSWKQVTKTFVEDLPKVLNTLDFETNLNNTVKIIMKALNAEIKLTMNDESYISDLIKELENELLYKLVRINSKDHIDAALSTVMILSIPENLIANNTNNDFLKSLKTKTFSKNLSTEISKISNQILSLMNIFCNCKR